MLIQGDCLNILPTQEANSVHCVVTSPPYFGLRDYGHDDQIGLEPTPEQYVAKLVNVFSHVWRVLRDDGTLWLNLGDSYAGSNKGLGADGTQYAGKKQATSRAWAIDKGKRTLSRWGGGNIPATDGLKPKDLIGIPWRVALALQADGWWLRSDIIWHKPNPMPESVTDRPTKAHEYIFLLTKSERYYYDAAAIAEPAIPAGAVVTNDAGKNSEMGQYGQTRGGFLREGGVTVGETRNRRSVWTIATAPYKGAHFAAMPPALVEPCILAGCPVGGIVLDPFAGSGTVGAVARATGREFVGIELNPDYVRLAEQRIGAVQVPLIIER